MCIYMYWQMNGYKGKLQPCHAHKLDPLGLFSAIPRLSHMGNTRISCSTLSLIVATRSLELFPLLHI